MVRIAIVDDNETWCFVLATVLGQEGHTVDIFTNTQNFLQQADHFDLAILDFSIPARPYEPELDGLAVTRQLKTDLANPPLVILISSFFTDDLLEINDFCPLADRVLSKQIGIKALLRHVEQLLATLTATPLPTPHVATENEALPHAIELDMSGDHSYELSPQVLTNADTQFQRSKYRDQPD